MRRLIGSRRLADLLTDQRGNAAIIFGLAAVPLLALGGGSVDFARRARIDMALQTASDTAALAAARHVQEGMLAHGGENWEEIKAGAEDVARKLIAASMAGLKLADEPDLEIAITEKDVTVSAHYDVKTAFLGVVGIDDLPTSTLAEVSVPEPVVVEIAFVLDYSLSMHENDKYKRMTAAAREFIDKVKTNRADRTTISIVPFSEFVYADVPNSDVREAEASEAGAWSGASETDGDWSGDGGAAPADEEAAGTSAVCLLNRDYPYSTTDETPTGLAATQWRQADPDSDLCKKYRDGGLKARELTDDFDGLSNALAAMQPVGWTNIALGTEIGWHMLSPNAPFESARGYDEPYLQKIMVVLTDGVQTVDATGPSGTASIEAANETTAELCENAKASSIKIYTIAYDVDDTSVHDLLSGCASGPEAYFEVRDSSGIAPVFNAIYEQIVESAWLSR